MLVAKIKFIVLNSVCLVFSLFVFYSLFVRQSFGVYTRLALNQQKSTCLCRLSVRMPPHPRAGE